MFRTLKGLFVVFTLAGLLSCNAFAQTTNIPGVVNGNDIVVLIESPGGLVLDDGGNYIVDGAGTSIFHALLSSATGGSITVANGSSLIFENNSAPGGLNGGVINVVDGTYSFFVDSTSLIHFLNNSAAPYGGAIYADGENSIVILGNNVAFTENSAGAGGAIFATNNNTIELGNNSTFTENSAQADGGAILAVGDTIVSLGNNSTFMKNSAQSGGGAILVNGGFNGSSSVALGNYATFTENLAGMGGGAIYVTNISSIELGNNATFTKNSTQSFFAGGAILVAGFSSVTLGNNATFTENSANSAGAIGVLNGSTVTLGDHATFIENSAQAGNGGAIYAFGGTVELGDYATFTENSAHIDGGAIHAGGSTVRLGGNATFTENTALGQGGAIHADMNSNVTIGENAIFVNNSAMTGGGGAIAVYATNTTLDGNTFLAGNTTGMDGGAILMDMFNVATATLNASTGDIAFSGNKSGVDFTYPANPTGGNANSIHLIRNTTLQLQGNNNIYFDDPISSGTTGGNSLTKSGTSFVQFLGSNRLNTIGFAGTNSVNITAGTFRLAETATFDASGAGNFNVATGAILAGQGSITANAFTISGTISPDSDRFEIPTFLAKGDPGATATNYNFFLNDKPTTVAQEKAIGTLTLVGNTTFTGATLAINTGGGTASDKIIIDGNLTNSGATIDFLNFQTGNYEILTANNSFGSTFNVLVGGSAPGVRHSIVLSNTGTSLFAALSATTTSLTWNGASGDLWRGTNNWSDTVSAPDTFIDEDTVTFTNRGVQTIALGTSNVTVANMTVTGGDYTFTGSGVGINSTGGLDIQGSKVTLANTGANTFAAGVNIESTGELIFNRSDNFTFSNAITGNGTVRQSGSGTVTLGGSQTGTLEQTAGTINLAGTWTGGFNQTAGRLTGSGTLTGSADFSGTVAPGTLTIGGAATFNSGSTYSVAIDRDNDTHSSITVNGEVNIVSGATLDINFTTGDETGGGTFDIITAGSFTGSLFSVTDTWATEFDQGIENNVYWISWVATDPEFADAVRGFATSNAYNVAVGMDEIVALGLTDEINKSGLHNALSGLPRDNPQALANAFAQLHGEVFAASQMNMINMQRGFTNRLPSAAGRFADSRGSGVYRGVAPCSAVGTSRSLNSWAAFTGDWLERKSVGENSGYNLRSAGVALGIERNISRNLFGGVAFGYDNAYQNFTSIRSNNQIDAFRTALYGGWRNRDVYIDGYAGYTKNWNKTRRDIDFAGFSGVARSKFDDDVFSTGFEIGRSFFNDRSSLTPSIGLHYMHLSSPNVKENGAGDADLIIHSSRYNSLRMPIGAKLSRDIFGGGIIWTPEARAFYVREFADASVRTGTSFAAVSSVPFYAESGNWGRNSARLGAGLNAQLSNWLNFRVDYDYEVFQHTSASWFGTSLGVRW